MKKIISLIALCAMFTISFADTTIGKCCFKGEQPPRCTTIGNVTVYYYEMSSSYESRGTTEYRTCSSDVWVIYNSPSDVKKLQVVSTNGSVQVCYNF